MNCFTYTPVPAHNEPPVRRAVVKNETNVRRVKAYLPSNYVPVLDPQGGITIVGHDNAGWTLEDYVIPRLASGLIVAQEVAA